MRKRNVFLFIQAALCILLCVLLSAGAVRLYAEGMTQRAAGNVESPVFTREAVLEKLTSLVPLFLLALGLLAASVVLNIRNMSPQVRDPESERNLACAGIAEPSEDMKREREKPARCCACFRLRCICACLLILRAHSSRKSWGPCSCISFHGWQQHSAFCV